MAMFYSVLNRTN